MTTAPETRRASSSSAVAGAAPVPGRHLGPGSERSFGGVFAVVFAVAGCFPLVADAAGPRWWAVAAVPVCLAAAFLAPGLLRPLNRAWFRLGLLLQRLLQPFVMGVLFYGVVLPVALVLRLAGKDPLRLRRDPAAETYWLRRDPPGPAPRSMAKQF